VVEAKGGGGGVLSRMLHVACDTNEAALPVAEVNGGGSGGDLSQYVACCVHYTSSTMPLKEAHRDWNACHILTGIAIAELCFTIWVF
jgi:hypothetical protein